MRRERILQCLAVVLAALVFAAPFVLLHRGRRLAPADPILTQLETMRQDDPEAPAPADPSEPGEKQTESDDVPQAARENRQTAALQDTRDTAQDTARTATAAPTNVAVKHDAFALSPGVAAAPAVSGAKRSGGTSIVSSVESTTQATTTVPYAGLPASRSGGSSVPRTPQTEPQTPSEPTSTQKSGGVALYTNMDHLPADGAIIREQVYPLRVSARTVPDGAALYTDSIRVTLDGVVQTSMHGYDNPEYDLCFEAPVSGAYGIYTLVVEVQHGGETVSRSWLLHYYAQPVGTPVGTVHLRLDASVLGLGVLEPAQEFELRSGDTAMDVVQRFLESSGYTLTLSRDRTYISAVSRPDMCVGFSGVPQTMRDRLAGGNIPLHEEKLNPDELKEGNITKDAGWIYTVNGDMLNRALTDATLSDGDELTLRFTLMDGDADYEWPENGTQ